MCIRDMKAAELEENKNQTAKEVEELKKAAEEKAQAEKDLEEKVQQTVQQTKELQEMLGAACSNHVECVEALAPKRWIDIDNGFLCDT
jgi:ribosomal protein S13